jgi:hypothetical protein
MKRDLFLLMFSLVSFVFWGEETNVNTMRVHLASGETVSYLFSDVDHIDFVNTSDTPDDPTVVADPKVGDYFYSDGTWSDGGLISINADGTEAVWQEVRPAPLAGKTVIGVVFTTDQSRMAQADIDAGYTHGYVISCKNVTDPNHQFEETVWYTREDEISLTTPVKLGTTWYATLTGSYDTEKILSSYPDDADYMVPMFYYGSVEFKDAAPENTSGWFIPSTGQMWDCLANLCGSANAAEMKPWRTMSYDATYYCTSNAANNALDMFKKAFEQIPDADPLSYDTMASSSRQYVSLRTSSRYEDDSSDIFNIGNDLIECMAAWLNEDCHARPILAF